MSPVRAFLKAMLIRGIKTWAQAALAYLSAGQVGVLDIDWVGFLSVTCLAMVYSFITSLATSLPEAESPLWMSKGEDDGEDA